MDILNPSPVLCLPQAMWLTYRVVMTRPDLSRDEVLDIVTPSAMRAATPQQGAHAQRALAGLRELNLVRETSDGLLQADKVKDAGSFLRLVRRQVVLPPGEVGQDFEGAPDLRSALIWLMRQSPMVPLHYAVNVQTNMPDGLFTNDTRWNGFRWWSQALGFGQEALKSLSKESDAKSKIIPDPTTALIDAIRRPFGDPLPRREQIPIDTFVQFLRSELPVLPGHPSATYPGLDGDQSQPIAALGLALSAAEHRGILTMSYQSDPSGVLALPDAQSSGTDRFVSNVTVKESSQ